jgi:hypothetical protein
MTVSVPAASVLFRACLLSASLPVTALQPSDANPVCTTWEACRVDAESAIAADQFERAHDLAWRTMQLRREQDPVVMYLVARAQSLSGRPADALVMLRRLAEMGVQTDAATSDDFARVRARTGWPEVAALASGATRRIEAVPTAVAGTDVAPPAEALAPSPREEEGGPPGDVGLARAPTSAAAAGPRQPLVAQDTVRFVADGFVPGGFAYDAVSGRFLVGSLDARKIEVVNERSARMADLVRADSAGFDDLVAMDIDTRRGDLWVISNDSPGGTSTLHKLQLIAGRPLATLRAPAGTSTRLTDLAITPGGTVLVLDADRGQIYRALPRAVALERVLALDVDGSAAIAPTDADGVCYVAHGAGVSRVDLVRRQRLPVTAGAGAPLDHVRGLWWHAGSLVILRELPSGARELHRLVLDRRGLTVAAADRMDVVLPATGAPLAATLSGNVLYLALRDGGGAAAAASDETAVVIRHVHLEPTR